MVAEEDEKRRDGGGGKRPGAQKRLRVEGVSVAETGGPQCPAAR